MKIRIPKEDCFYIQDICFYGPFHESGEPFEIIELSDDTRYFQQGPGIFGENSVTHLKSDGSITINSLIGSADFRPRSPGSYTQGWHQATLRSASGVLRTVSTFPEILSGGTVFSASPSAGSSAAVVHRVMPDGFEYISVGLLNGGKKFPDSARFNSIITRFKPYVLKDGTTSRDQIWLRWEAEFPPSVQVNSIGEAHGLLRQTKGTSPYYYSEWKLAPKWFARAKYKANVQSALSWYRKISNDFSLGTQALPDVQSYGDLVQAACENVNPNTINAIAFIKDLKDIKSLVPKLNALSSVRTHASNYLGVEYGVLPTIDDLKTIWKSFATSYFFDRNGFQRASGYDTNASLESRMIDGDNLTVSTTIDRRVHLAINQKDTGLDALTERLRKIGIFPSLTNLWDLVPYSFVLDWFIDVGSVLERIDTRHQLLNLDIKYCIQSQKVISTTSLVNHKLGLYCEFENSSYSRTVGTSVPQPVIFKENRVTAQNHWVEGTALILARKQK